VEGGEGLVRSLIFTLGAAPLSLPCLQHGGDERSHIVDDTDVGHVENRCVPIGVDGHDELRPLHADSVLKSPRYAACSSSTVSEV